MPLVVIAGFGRAVLHSASPPSSASFDVILSQLSHSLLNRTALAFSVCPHKAAAPCSLLLYLFFSVPSTPAFPWDAETGLHAVLGASVCGKHWTCHTHKVCAEVLGSPGVYVHAVHLRCSCGFSLAQLHPFVCQEGEAAMHRPAELLEGGIRSV